MITSPWRPVTAIVRCAVAMAFAASPLRAVAQDVPPPPPPPPPPSDGADAFVPPPPSFTAELRVTAVATYEARPDEPSVVYRAKVTVNGVPSGETPYAATLAPGEYRVDLESDNQRASTTVQVAAGQRYNVNGRFFIPLTEAEKRARQEAVLAKQRAEEAEAEARWREVEAQWKAEDDSARKKRRPFVFSGASALIAGTGLAIAGAACASLAKEEQAKYLDYKEAWQNATDLTEIDDLYDHMNETADVRDADVGMAAAFLAVGGAAVIAGIVVLAIMPGRPEEPERWEPGGAPALAVAPLVAPDRAGLLLEMRF